MILHPAVLALLFLSAASSLLLLYAAGFAVRILRRWDLHSGSEEQLRLERRTYLISTVLGHLCALQLLSPFLYVFTADKLRALFTGAMCAAGTLNVNAWGYPALFLKLAAFLAAGLWLVLNATDTRAPDYPLIRPKYALLLLMAPLFAAETAAQGAYFLGLEADLITSCCGSLFSAAGADRGLGADLAAAPLGPAKLAFFGTLGGAVLVGLYSRRTGRARYLFAGLSAASLAVGVTAVLSFISVYVYELPTHHCPFCLLQGEYGFIGYPLYLALLGGGVAGVGVGVVQPFRHHPSLGQVIPRVQNRLVLWAAAAFALCLGLAAWAVLRSNFTL